MKISTKTRYGMSFMIDLAQRYGSGPVALKDVAARAGISKKYLEQVVCPFAHAGLVSVTRGAGGGYELARDPGEITLGDVARASGDGLELLDCTSGLLSCSIQGSCPSQRIWKGMEKAISDYLDGLTLKDIIDDIPENATLRGACTE
ncbi:MAG: Rrf2 family transcriptional regulator [Eggerthellaceae bacterium]|nr:Rrf2 family transcriptional regulator [Eggerthellaceae bacterium]